MGLIWILTDFGIRAIDCKNKDNEVTGQAVTHEEFKIHESGEICMSTTERPDGGKKYEVFILSPKKPGEKEKAIIFYNSARFICHSKKSGTNICSLANPEQKCWFV